MLELLTVTPTHGCDVDSHDITMPTQPHTDHRIAIRLAFEQGDGHFELYALVVVYLLAAVTVCEVATAVNVDSCGE